jgi:prophage DNA circulation protein
MSAWRDQLQEGSFRGAAFLIEAADADIGRRVQVHEYPLRDDPFVEDLGRKGRELSLELFVVGDAYMADRDALRDAIESPGTGTLVHPYLGEMTVAVTRCKMSESTREGGMARFSVTFVESTEPEYPSASESEWTIIVGETVQTSDALELSFDDAFDVLDVAGYVLDEATAIVTDWSGYALDLIGEYVPVDWAWSLAGEVMSLVAGVDTLVSGTSAAFGGSDLATSVTATTAAIATAAALPSGTSYDADAVASSASSILAAAGIASPTPAQNSIATVQAVAATALYAAAGAPVAGVSSAAGVDSVTAAVRLCRDMAAFAADFPTVPETTANRRIQSANQAALLSLIHGAALAQEAQLSFLLPFASQSDAAEVRDDLAERLDAFAESASDDTLYMAMIDLRVDVIRGLTSLAADLADVAQYTPRAVLPALATAHRLYGDASRAADIVARNKIRHPGFVPGGEALEVSSV